MSEEAKILTRIERLLARELNVLKGALTRGDAAAYLSISTRQLDILAADGEIPRTKVGRKTVFQIKYLDAFLDKNTEMSREEVEKSVAKLS